MLASEAGLDEPKNNGDEGTAGWWVWDCDCDSFLFEPVPEGFVGGEDILNESLKIGFRILWIFLFLSEYRRKREESKDLRHQKMRPRSIAEKEKRDCDLKNS